MTADTLGGVWTFALELARELSEDGVEIILATLGGEGTEEQRDEALAIPELRLLPSRYKLEWMEDPWSDVAESGAWLLGVERRFRPDVIHLNSLVHGGLPFEAPIVLTVHSCVPSWWSAVRRGPLPVGWNQYRDQVKASLKSVDLLVTPTNSMLRMVHENHSRDLPPVRVISNGRNPALFRPGPKEPFVLTAGRLWDDAKNVAGVAKVAERLPWATYVAGDNRSPDGVKVEFPSCRMLGRLTPPALAEWYACASIYALPARYEPFGLSALEAAMSGCALVLGNIDSLREVWDEAAIYVSPDDPDQLADALRELMSDPVLRAEMARRSLERARLYPARKTAEEYLNAYAAVAGERRACCAS